MPTGWKLCKKIKIELPVFRKRKGGRVIIEEQTCLVSIGMQKRTHEEQEELALFFENCKEDQKNDDEGHEVEKKDDKE